MFPFFLFRPVPCKPGKLAEGRETIRVQCDEIEQAIAQLLPV